MRVLWILLTLGMLGVRSVAATTWVVAPSGGDFTQIQAALNAAVAGDVIDVRTGTYAEKVSLPRSGNLGSGPIILRAAAGHTPIIDGTGVAGSDLIRIDNRSYVQVIGFELRNNTGVTDGSGIRITGSGDQIALRNNRIHAIRGSNAMGITVYGTAATAVSNLIVDGNEIYDCDAAPSEALTLNGNVTDFAVTNNHVHDVNNIGIDAIGGETDIQPDPTKVARRGLISGNTVERARSIYGGGFAGGIYVDGGTDIVIEHNTVTESDLGIEVGAENSGAVTSGVVVRNNVLRQNDKAGLVFGGYAASVGRVRHCDFRNNVLYHNNTLDTEFGELWIQYADQNTVRNNIIWSNTNRVLLTSDAGNVDNVVDYNLWHSDGAASGARFTWNGEEYLGFTAYRSGTNQDAHSSFVAPQLTAPASDDFHLQPTSPAINAGDPATAAAVGETDLDGAPRIAGPRIDIGVDEIACGDGVLNPGEACDDHNTTSGDGCDANCTVTACGNGVVTFGEQCDDGNLNGGDCCDGSCQLDVTGTTCNDGNPCTRLDSCTAGVCAGVAAPEPTCRAATTVRLQIKNGSPDRRDALAWKWQRGDATALSDFGDPVNATDYTLCVYDTSAGTPQIALRAEIPHGGQCHNKPCWKPSGSTGFKYADRDLTPSGIKSLQLKAGSAGAASVAVKGQGDRLQPPLPFHQDPSVTIQLRNSLGACWGSTLTTPAARNDGAQFSDRLP